MGCTPTWIFFGVFKGIEGAQLEKKQNMTAGQWNF
jgi:hypothetical protein